MWDTVPLPPPAPQALCVILEMGKMKRPVAKYNLAEVRRQASEAHLVWCRAEGGAHLPDKTPIVSHESAGNIKYF